MNYGLALISAKSWEKTHLDNGENGLKLEEYKIVAENMRHYSKLRFAQLTLYFALSAGLMSVIFTSDPKITGDLRICLVSIGILTSLVFFVIELRITKFWNHFRDQAKILETALKFRHYSKIPRWCKMVRISGATQLLIGVGGVFWIFILFM